MQEWNHQSRVFGYSHDVRAQVIHLTAQGSVV